MENYEFKSCIGKRKKSENTKKIDNEIFKICQLKTLPEIDNSLNIIRFLIGNENADTSQRV